MLQLALAKPLEYVPAKLFFDGHSDKQQNHIFASVQANSSSESYLRSKLGGQTPFDILNSLIPANRTLMPMKNKKSTSYFAGICRVRTCDLHF